MEASKTQAAVRALMAEHDLDEVLHWLAIEVFKRAQDFSKGAPQRKAYLGVGDYLVKAWHRWVRG